MSAMVPLERATVVSNMGIGSPLWSFRYDL